MNDILDELRSRAKAQFARSNEPMMIDPFLVLRLIDHIEGLEKEIAERDEEDRDAAIESRGDDR